MEPQMTPSIFLPTLCPMSYSLRDSPLTANKQLIQPTMIAGQPLLLHPHQGTHVVVQMHQVVPFIATDNYSLPVQTYSTPPSLIGTCPTIPACTLPQIPTTAIAPSSKLKPIHSQQLRHKSSNEENNNALNKIQKKKKVSPSAKRRSRLRLLAFLEAKKLASQQADEQNCEETESDNKHKQNESDNYSDTSENSAKEERSEIVESETKCGSSSPEQCETNTKIPDQVETVCDVLPRHDV